MNKADKLLRRSREAARVRVYQTDPDVVALRMEINRAWVERLGWTGMVLGLLFTMVNVQIFAAQGAALWSLPWLIAWFLDPMVSLVLLAILLGESMTSRWRLPTDGWVRATKWVCLGATYAMNTWHSWAALEAAGILLHSVPPALVFFGAEAMPQLRHRMSEAVDRAHAAALSTPTPAPAGEAHRRPSQTPTGDLTGEPEHLTTPVPELRWVSTEGRATLPLVARPDSAPVRRARSNSGQPEQGKARQRADKGRPLPPAAKAPGAVKARSVEELAHQLDALISSGDLTETASTNRVRQALACSPQRAKEAAAYWRATLRHVDSNRLTVVSNSEGEAA